MLEIIIGLMYKITMIIVIILKLFKIYKLLLIRKMKIGHMRLCIMSIENMHGQVNHFLLIQEMMIKDYNTQYKVKHYWGSYVFIFLLVER